MRAAGERAAVHLERYVAHLESFLPRAAGTWQLGEEGYSRILREREVLADDARSLRERGQREFDRLDAEMTALAQDATGNADYVAVLRANDADHPTTEQAMLDAYAEWTGAGAPVPRGHRARDASRRARRAPSCRRRCSSDRSSASRRTPRRPRSATG